MAATILAFAVGLMILQYVSERWQKQMIELAEETSRQMEWELEQDMAYNAQFNQQSPYAAEVPLNLMQQDVQLGEQQPDE